MDERKVEAPFEEVLCWSGWWECPRHGVALIGGAPHVFDCQFSEQLDDYSEEYQIWVPSDDELADELDSFKAFVAWRKQFDLGRRQQPPPQDPAADRRRQRLEQGIPPDARQAKPEWHLDSNRSFADAPPRHQVRWVFNNK